MKISGVPYQFRNTHVHKLEDNYSIKENRKTEIAIQHSAVKKKQEAKQFAAEASHLQKGI